LARWSRVSCWSLSSPVSFDKAKSFLARAGQTAYRTRPNGNTVRIVEEWHPHRGIALEVIRWEIRCRPPHVVVRYPDGSGARVPLQWTDAGGGSPLLAVPRALFTAQALLDLTALVEAMGQRGAE
jgi:hypothetical protein